MGLRGISCFSRVLWWGQKDRRYRHGIDCMCYYNRVKLIVLLKNVYESVNFLTMRY